MTQGSPYGPWTMGTDGETEVQKIVMGSIWAGDGSNYPTLQLLITWVPL